MKAIFANSLDAAALDESDWIESKHPRGQPENKGQFKSGGSKQAESKFENVAVKKSGKYDVSAYIKGPSGPSRALEYYKENYFEGANSLMRGNVEAHSDTGALLIQGIKNQFEKSVTTKDMKLYRGIDVMNSVAQWYLKKKPGDIIVVDAFNSTSADEKVGAHFAEGRGFGEGVHGGGVLMEIEVPKGSHALDMEKLARGSTVSSHKEKGSSGEAEVLLDGGCRYQILAVDKKGHRVKMRLLDQGVPRGEEKWNLKEVQSKSKIPEATEKEKAAWAKAGLPDLSKIDLLNSDLVREDKRLAFRTNSPFSTKPSPNGMFIVHKPLVAAEIKKREKSQKGSPTKSVVSLVKRNDAEKQAFKKEANKVKW